jgi:galactose oxidase
MPSFTRFAPLARLFFLVVSSVPATSMAGAPATVRLPSSTDIIAVHSGQCVNVGNNNMSAGAAILQAVCDGAQDNTWTLVPIGGNFHIVAGNSGQCLNVPGNSLNAGTALIQWPCSANSLNDQWRLVPAGTSVRIVSASSGLCVNVSGGSQSPGAPIIQWPCSANALNDQFDIYTPSLATQTLPTVWSHVIKLPVTPIGLANLPDGRLLMWSANTPYHFEGDIGARSGQTWTGIFDPATETSTSRLETEAASDLFCPGTALLPDGRLLINGGSSSPKTTLYDPASGQWSAAATMNVPRGYEGDTPLSDGGVLTLGGSWSGGRDHKNGEVWTGSGWRLLSGVPETNVVGPDPKGVYRGDNHLWLFAASNGTVFHAGPSSQMNWIRTEGQGSITSAGLRGSDPFSINGNAVMYDIGKILKAGGAVSYDQDVPGQPTYAGAATWIIDIGAGSAGPVALTQVASMTYPRSFANGVALPDGEVLIVGGQSIPQPFTDTAAVLVPELWNPATQRWSLLAPMQIPRTYHSTALLMADGRVFVGGGGQCGTGCPQNHLDAEILTPPYLLNADGTPATRPVLTSTRRTVAAGATLDVTVQGAVASFALMRASATTHTVNNDQRRIPLFAQARGNGRYQLLVPADPGISVPGDYMLFAVSASGVPSVSVPVRVGPPGSTSPPARAQPCAVDGGTCVLPAGVVATVWYGAGSQWRVIGNRRGTIGCSSTVFGGIQGTDTPSCLYVPAPPAAAVGCAAEHGVCTLPAGASATVWYGADTHWAAKPGVTGAINCNNRVFGDPNFRVFKGCSYELN